MTVPALAGAGVLFALTAAPDPSWLSVSLPSSNAPGNGSGPGCTKRSLFSSPRRLYSSCWIPGGTPLPGQSLVG